MAETDDVEAPHGRDEHGVPLAPYGHRQDGRPKLSNRGRSAKAPAKKTAPNIRSGNAPASRSHKQTKNQLMQLVEMVTTPAGSAANTPAVRRRLGDRRADALAGSALIVEAYMDPMIDAVITLSEESKPGLLAWMDEVDDKLPYLAMVNVGVQMAKSLVQNWFRPDPKLARAARLAAPVRARQLAMALEREAAELGVNEDQVQDEMAEVREEQAA